MLTLPSYVLITPARNEAESIELTIQSVVTQNCPANQMDYRERWLDRRH